MAKFCKALCGALALLTACQPQRIELSALAQGEWNVRGVSSEGAVVSQRGGDVALVQDTLKPVSPESIQSTLGRSSITLIRVADVYFSRTAPPLLVQSPVHAHRYAFEHDDAIWLFAAPDTFVKLTTDDDVATLRGKQREGEVILYWSTQPMWSADGRFVSFITNRESVRGGPERQSIWMIDVASRQQRPIYARRHTAAHTEGVLGDRFLFSSDRTAGVLAVSTVSGAVRRLSQGFVLTTHPGGVAVAIATGDPAQRTVLIYREDKRHLLPMPATGFAWSTQAQFSPSGERLALVATNGAGAYRLYVFDGDREEPLSIDMPGGPSTGPAWISESALVFAGRKPSEPSRTWLARLK